MRALEFITDHVIFKLRYNQIYQMKTTLDSYSGTLNLTHTQVPEYGKQKKQLIFGIFTKKF